MATVAGAAAATLGLTVMVGWHTHTVGLIQVLPVFAPMRYNTAVGFLLSGIGLVALVHHRSRLAVVLGSVVGAIGLLTLIQYIFGVELGIDQFFLEAYITVETSHPGRMAPSTALSFSLTAGALLTSALAKHVDRRFRLTGGLGAIILALGSVAFLGYLTGAQTAFGWGELTREENADAIDLMLLDVVMPKLGGRVVFKRIHKEHPQVRVLFASGYSMNAIHTNFVLDEGLTLLQKPHNRAELLRKVREVLDRK